MEQAPPPPQVSVLIVSYNSAGPLRRCLETLERSKDRGRFEIIVVDNGSQDDSPRLDAEFPKATLLRLPRNFGLTKALNIAMRTAQGEFFFFIEPDVVVQADTVASLAAKLEAEQEAVAVCPLLVTPGGEPAPTAWPLPDPRDPPWREGPFLQPLSLDLSAEKIPVPCVSWRAVMARAYFLKGLRYIDERYAQSWADVEICYQIRRSSRKILLYPGVRVVHTGDGSAFPDDSSARGLLAADHALGAAAYAGKHAGFLTGLKIRLAAILNAFGSLPGLRDFGFHFARLRYLLAGQKIDGSQTVL